MRMAQGRAVAQEAQRSRRDGRGAGPAMSGGVAMSVATCPLVPAFVRRGTRSFTCIKITACIMNRESRCLVLDDGGVRGRDSHVDAWQRVDRSTGAIRTSAEGALWSS